MDRLIVLLGVVALALTVNGETGVVFFSRVLPENAVEGSKVNVTYEVLNIGDGSVYDVTTEDAPLTKNKKLKVVAGEVGTKIESLDAGASFKFDVQIECSAPGDFQLSPAVLEYYESSAEDATAKRLFSTPSDSMAVESLEDYKRRTDMHLDVLAIFFALASVLTLAPLSGYLTTISKLSAGGTKVTKKGR